MWSRERFSEETNTIDSPFGATSGAPVKSSLFT
jgi:hypothetical protein